MTAPSSPTWEADTVKGLARLEDRVRHGRETKHVDARPVGNGRLLPDDAADYTQRGLSRSHREIAASSREDRYKKNRRSRAGLDLMQ
jgi:hypothetical protein